ncbi:MAG: CPBP family intramembrane metalloprotease [Candidatus Marinimicrobia bacterium]|nr:CPBP family intramembrane metalloprotease [Candidatus Neomarinimicrobiota bacterium]
MRPRDLLPFFGLTFLIAWGILALYIFASEMMVRRFGNLTGEHPLFYLAVYAPAIAALVLVLRRQGIPGLRRFLSQLLVWRLPKAWTLFLIAGLPIPFFLGALVQGHLSAWALDAPRSLLPLMGMMLIKGPIEELGWRGLAQPLLQRRMRPLAAALVLGVAWGLWHYPAFLLSGTPQSAWHFGAFFVGTIALSVIVTALFNLSQGSLLVPVLFHFQMINPLWPDGQPFDTLFFVLLAAGVTWLNWKSMWGGVDAVTKVCPGALAGGLS